MTTYINAWFQNTFVDPGDPRSKGWVLVDSPLPPTFILLIYFLLVTRVGPRLMKHREPFNLRTLMLTYNVLQVCANLMLALILGRLIIFERLTCMEVYTNDSYRNEQIPHAIWLYYMNKYVDLLDTFFFVLTKKQRHVTPLHLIHHISIVLVIWLATKYYPSGVFAMGPYLNTWVHAVMYAYYFCALYFGSVAIRWKQLVTTLQLIQFLIGNIVMTIHMVNPWCSCPKLFLLPYYLLCCVFIYMFSQFYCRNYYCKKEK